MSESVERIHLRRLIRLRYLMAGGQLAAVLGARYGLGVALPAAPMLVLIGTLAALNVFTQRRLASARPVSYAELGLQLAADIGQLSLLLYLSGGYANPFVFMLLPMLAIAAAALPTWLAAGVAAGTVLCYSLLLVLYVPLPALAHLWLFTPALLQQLGMSVCFVVSGALIVFYVLRTRATLREKDRELAEARERAIRNEDMAVLGGIAAGTAHELGTPLATMTFIAEDLAAELADPEQRAQLQMLREQLGRCRVAVDELSRSAGELSAGRGRPEELEAWLEQLSVRWRARFPDVTFRLRLQGPCPPVRLFVERAVEQAITAVVSNAARVSREVEVDAWWDGDMLRLEVRDSGPGIPASLKEVVGREPLGRKPGVQGMGLGLYLAAEALERLGGRLDLRDREAGGTRAEMVLPLRPLRTDEEHDERTETAAVTG